VGANVFNAPFVGELATLKNNCFSLHGFPNKPVNIFQSNQVEPQFTNKEYHRLKSGS